MIIELSGSLNNVFDKEAVQNELDLQRTVSQSFNQNVQAANTEINQHLDQLKTQLEKGEISQTEYDGKVTGWQRGQVLLNMISAGLSAPTQSAAGIAAATASPALSYRIGQYFKEENAEGTGTHILAHAILGAAVAAAGDNSAIAGAISAGGAEAAAPYISKWLYDKEKGSDLTAEEKETVTAITNLLGMATGAAVGNTTANAVQGSLNADSAVENNNGARVRRNTRNPLWTEAQARQNDLNAARINALINQIRRIEPDFKGIATSRDPNRPIANEEVQAYEQYLNRVSPKHPVGGLPQPSFATNVLPRTDRSNLNTILNELARDISLNQLGQAFNARTRVNGNLDARNINLQVGLRTVRPNPSASQNGMPVYSHLSEKEIFSVYQQYTGSQPSFRNIPNKGVLASTTIQSGSWQGTTVVLRNFSTSQYQTGARWTIEFQNFPQSIRGQAMELKFR